MNTTSDAGSQYRCGREGRGIQPSSTLQPTSNSQTNKKSIENAHYQLDHHDGPTDRPTNRRTDKASYRVACPQLKIQSTGMLFSMVSCPTVLLKKSSVESHIIVGFSVFLSSIGVYEHVTSKNKIIPWALLE